MSLCIENVTKEFRISHGALARATHFTALKNVSLSVEKGESFGLVGESGSGKTTLTRLILQLDRLTSGRILFNGADLGRLPARELRRLRSRIQIVFQDPYASLASRWRSIARRSA